MNKKVLLLYFTQSGQLKEILDHFSEPFDCPDILIETVSITPKKAYDFPWKLDAFFDTMPESVLGIPTPLNEFNFKESKYDLIVVAYQPWFLSPSIPITSLLIHDDFRKIAQNTPVITLIGSRNMWISAQEKVKKMLQEAGAILVGNIALSDKNHNVISVVTILYWMRTGKRDNYLGIFPKPGVSELDVNKSKMYGTIAKMKLLKNDWSLLQPELVTLGAILIRPNLMFIESRASKIFTIWANFTINKKNRAFRLRIFKYYLFIALFIVAPIILLINNIIFRPFIKAQITKKKFYYSGLR